MPGGPSQFGSYLGLALSCPATAAPVQSACHPQVLYTRVLRSQNPQSSVLRSQQNSQALALTLSQTLCSDLRPQQCKSSCVSSKMQLQRQTLDPVLSQLQPLFITRVAREGRGQCTVRPRRHRGGRVRGSAASSAGKASELGVRGSMGRLHGYHLVEMMN